MKIHCLTLAAFLCCASPVSNALSQKPSAAAASTTQLISATSLPTSITFTDTIRFKGELVKAFAWRDELGDNLMLLSEVAPFPSPRPEESDDDHDAELHAYHFVNDSTGWAQLWQVQDFERHCPFDLSVRFLDSSVRFTDLDGDGIAETTFLYTLGCRSDVSPSPMKLMMHEGKPKYAIRGMRLLHPRYGNTERTMHIDPAFNQAPQSFRDYAIVLWTQFEYEHLGGTKP